ncbi:MAG TPA: hypothetical protein VJ821_17450 [Anaerolineales bacterium]|nr:hypothetical protein [Anaerolineales bacterium]
MLRKFAALLAKSLAILFSGLSVIALVLALLLVSVQQIVFNPETYKRIFAEQNLYERLPALIAENSSWIKNDLGDPCADETAVCTLESSSPAGTLLSSASPDVQACAQLALGAEVYETLYSGERSPTRRETRRINACIREVRRNERAKHPGIGGDLVPILDDFSQAQWEGLFRILLPADELRRMSDSALDEVFAYLNGQSESASVSFVGLKQRFTGESGEELILFLLASQPACTSEQLAQILAGNFENGGDTAFYCAVPEEALPLVMPPMRHRLEKVAAQIPDEAVLSKPAAGNEFPFGADPLASLRIIRKWIPFSFLLPLALFLLVTVFGVRSRKAWLRGWGMPLLIAGSLALGIGLTAQPLLEWLWINHAAEQLSPIVSGGPGKLGYAVARSITQEIRQWLLLESAAVIVLGLAAVVLSNHSRNKPGTTARSFIPPELAPQPESPKTPSPRTRDETGYS